MNNGNGAIRRKTIKSALKGWEVGLEKIEYRLKYLRRQLFYVLIFIGNNLLTRKYFAVSDFEYNSFGINKTFFIHEKKKKKINFQLLLSKIAFIVSNLF